MAGGLGRFCLTMLIVWVMRHHYFHADIVEWEIITVITVETLAFNVEIRQVRIIDKALFYIYMNSLDEWLILTIEFNNIEIILLKNEP